MKSVASSETGGMDIEVDHCDCATSFWVIFSEFLVYWSWVVATLVFTLAWKYFGLGSTGDPFSWILCPVLWIASSDSR